MDYLLIERKAWLQILAEAARANHRMLELERYFFPAGHTG